LAAIVLLLTH